MGPSGQRWCAGGRPDRRLCRMVLCVRSVGPVVRVFRVVSFASVMRVAVARVLLEVGSDRRHAVVAVRVLLDQVGVEVTETVHVAVCCHAYGRLAAALPLRHRIAFPVERVAVSVVTGKLYHHRVHPIVFLLPPRPLAVLLLLVLRFLVQRPNFPIRLQERSVDGDTA